MVRTTLALVAAMAVVCARAEAAVYTTTKDLSISYSDADNSYGYLAFVPNFNYSLGTLTSTTFTLVGSAQETISYYQNLPPSSGTFTRQVQFNADAPITLSTAPIIAASPASPTTLRDNFSVNASATYPATYKAAPGTDLDLSFSIESVLQPPSCCAYTSLAFNGRLTASYAFNPVPEPISASLLLAPMLGVAAFRRRGQAVTTTE